MEDTNQNTVDDTQAHNTAPENNIDSNDHVENPGAESSNIDYAALRDKYHSQGMEKGREEGFKQAQQQLINENILDENGRPSAALSQFIDQQTQQQNQQYTVNGNDAQPGNMDNMVQAFEMMQATKNIQSTGSKGLDKYGDEWQDTAKFFVEDSEKDPDSPGVLYEASAREDGHEILHYLHKNPAELEKFKGMKPRLLKVAMNNLSKTLRNTAKETPAEPLSESKGTMSSSKIKPF